MLREGTPVMRLKNSAHSISAIGFVHVRRSLRRFSPGQCVHASDRRTQADTRSISPSVKS